MAMNVTAMGYPIAVPSMLMVAPSGSTSRDTVGETPLELAHRIVTGRVPAEDAQPIAVASAGHVARKLSFRPSKKK